MITRLSLSTRLALLFAACAAMVALVAGLLFSQASETHFIELDQQLLDDRLASVRNVLQGAEQPDELHSRRAVLLELLARQPDEGLRIRNGDGQTWFDSRPQLPAPPSHQPGLSTLHTTNGEFRAFDAPLSEQQPDGPRVTLLLDITHHQHFLQRMQRLIWLTVGLSALATALLGAWVARLSLRPLRRMSEVASGVSAQSLTTRLPLEGMPPELATLGHSFNAMLGRLDDAFQRLSAFSADIAHELRTPLSNLLTHTQVTLTRPRSREEYEEALHSNLEELQRMAQLINDMLYLAKADHGLLIPHRETLQLADEIDGLLEFFTPLAEDIRANMSRKGQAQWSGDRAMLRRALSNLLDNALRFTPSGGEVVVNVTQAGATTVICVTNSGPAIPLALLPRLFDRFYRVDPARQAGPGEHAGLGLAITQSIIRAHGGDIACTCADGWTRFTVELPT